MADNDKHGDSCNHGKGVCIKCDKAAVKATGSGKK